MVCEEIKITVTGQIVSSYDSDTWKVIDISNSNLVQPCDNVGAKNLSIVWPISKNGCIELIQLKNMSL